MQLRAILAGLFFGVWPLLMNRSGLGGNISAAVFSGTSFLLVLPLALSGASATLFTSAKWLYALTAGLAGAIGVIAFNGGLAKSTPQNVGSFFVMMMCVQIAVPVANHIASNGGLSVRNAFGFFFAFIAAYLLSK
ncbi:MAG: hypothetical protein WAX44_03705 [Minisyncoccia bacterium]